MRYIDINKLSLPHDWEARADAVQAELQDATPEERKTIIARNQSLWRELKEELSKLSNGKCWYCEMREARSDKAVDHFRPKNRVAECDDHKGYWWLAFDSSNYRLSCTFCNSRRVRENTDGGKQDHFPLLDEEKRAKSSEDNISDEQPILLDPTNANDPELLWFYNTGTPTPKFSQDEDDVKYERASKSIKLYHLDEEDIVENRLDLYNELSKKVRQANDALDDAVQAKRPVVKKRAQRRFGTAVEEIREALVAHSELSGSAKVFLRTLASSGQQGRWLNKLLEKLKRQGLIQ